VLTNQKKHRKKKDLQRNQVLRKENERGEYYDMGRKAFLSCGRTNKY